MSIPGFSAVEQGFFNASAVRQSTPVVIASDQNNFQPSSEADWTQRTLWEFGPSVDVAITGFESAGLNPLYGTEVHPYAVKTIVVNPGAQTIALLLRHQNSGSFVGNKIDCPRASDLLLERGDRFRMSYEGTNWVVREVTRSGRLNILDAPQIVADQTDYATTGWRLADEVHVDSDAVRTFHGLQAAAILTPASYLAHKTRKLMVNDGAFDWILANESATELTAANRIRTFTGDDVTVAPNNFVACEYDDIIGRWRAG